MTDHGEIEITVGDVNDVEARVLARFIAPDEEPRIAAGPIVLHGTLRGPQCETARTLPAVFMFREVPSASPPVAEAIVTDPCVWSNELPHLYQCDVAAKRGDEIVAEYHGTIGFRRRASG
jgi:hypothetical protein